MQLHATPVSICEHVLDEFLILYLYLNDMSVLF